MNLCHHCDEGFHESIKMYSCTKKHHICNECRIGNEPEHSEGIIKGKECPVCIFEFMDNFELEKNKVK
jgi:hypothetical protein